MVSFPLTLSVPLLSLTELPPTRVSEKWQLGHISKLLGFSLLPSEARLKLCVHWGGMIYKQAGPKRKNPLLWRIRSVAELGRGGNPDLVLPSSSSPHLPEAVRAEAHGAVGKQTYGLGDEEQGAVPGHVFLCRCVGTCKRSGFRPLGTPPTLAVFVWITLRGILVLSNNGLRFI